MNCYFVSDLHGIQERYEKLIRQVKLKKPGALFIGGDIFPNFYPKMKFDYNDFVFDFLVPLFQDLKTGLRDDYPQIFLILGNDDPKMEEPKIIHGQKLGLWQYIHNQKTKLGKYDIYGYANIPPTPFIFKDWERYDVSRYVDPGCIHPTEGKKTVDDGVDMEYSTIQKEIELLVNNDDLSNAVFLFHSPPYQTKLDRAALDGKMFDHVPLDVHVGSIAIQRFIQNKQPMLTLHGHIHESSRITGEWKEQMGKTWMYSAAYEFPNLAIVMFDLDDLSTAERIVI